jgi:hypothetical protein
MPMVRAYVMTYFDQHFRSSKTDKTSLQLLEHACKEIVPAGLNSKLGPLTPGSIEFISMTVESGLGINVVIDIEAYDYEDRAVDIEKRAAAMKKAFKAIFPAFTFAVFPKLVKAGWSSDTDDPEFDGDMSIEAAIERYYQKTGHGQIVYGHGGIL